MKIKTLKGTGLELKRVRTFSEDFKKKKVQEITARLTRVSEVCKEYQVSGSAVYKWIYRYSNMKKKEKIILPDLMAAEIVVSSASEKKEEIPVIKKTQPMSESIYSKPYMPKPVKEKKRPYVHFKALPPDPPKEKIERPKAEYSNTPSPYGIYDELKQSWK